MGKHRFKWKSPHVHLYKCARAKIFVVIYFVDGYDVIAYKIMWICEHETNDHSISMSLILTLPLNKRTTMVSHTCGTAKYANVKISIKQLATQWECEKTKKKIFFFVVALLPENKCDARLISSQKFRSFKIHYTQMVSCIVSDRPNATKINKYGLAYHQTKTAHSLVPARQTREWEKKFVVIYCV